MIGQSQWSGRVAVAGTGVTKVTVIDDITANPVTHGNLRFNQSVDAGDLFLLNNLGIDAGLTVWRSTEVFLTSPWLGFRYQFLNHGAGDNVWVGALHGAFDQRIVATTSGNSGDPNYATADSKITSSQAGISVGYKLNDVVPYASFIYESHNASTEVKNAGGKFGPYTDTGSHQNYSVGLASHGTTFHAAVEYSYIDINWSGADRTSQRTLGARLGFEF